MDVPHLPETKKNPVDYEGNGILDFSSIPDSKLGTCSSKLFLHHLHGGHVAFAAELHEVQPRS